MGILVELAKLISIRVQPNITGKNGKWNFKNIFPQMRLALCKIFRHEGHFKTSNIFGVIYTVGDNKLWHRISRSARLVCSWISMACCWILHAQFWTSSDSW